MFTSEIFAIAAPTIARGIRRWIFQLGGLGLIPLGLIDSSVVPLPGSMDALTIFLSARSPQLWVYYAVMATLGSVIGGYVTYRLARKGGKETIERKYPAETLQKVYKIFARWGFAAIVIVALLPPPVPVVVFVFAAGAMQYSVKRFLVALTFGRVVRYTLLAFLAARYGRQVIAILLQHGRPAMLAIIGLFAVALAAFIFVLVNRRMRGEPSS